MGYFKNLKFGTIQADKDKVQKFMELIKGGVYRTDGTFAPGYVDSLLSGEALAGKLKGMAFNPNPNTNKPADWQPVVSIRPIIVNREKGDPIRGNPGFLPPEFLSTQILDKDAGKGKFGKYSWNEGNAWVGHLMSSHLESPFYESKKSKSTSSRIDESTTTKSVDEPYSARDYYIRFNDQGTDYFRHGLHIEGLTKTVSGKNARESYIGKPGLSPFNTFSESQFENNDPVIFGFDIIFDTINSPLLNGSVEDFISEFSYINEVASRAIVIDDFKRQFSKIFRTRGNLDTVIKNEYESENVLINNQRQGQSLASSAKSNLNAYANTPSKDKDFYRTGKRAYMSYYLQKIDGLAKLVESNTPETKKFLVDYPKDLIKLTFIEDLSLTMGTLAHLYKLLYWSRPNGKNIIPENLLRFNCDIVVSECRNFNRVRKALNTGDIEILKDNVSRYIYSLRECQFFFDKMSHEDSIDMGNIKTTDTYEVNFNYKYSALKLEKWIPDMNKFGRYVGYNGGAIWKIGNKNAKETIGEGKFVMTDTSVPRFYTVNTNTLRENGVMAPIIMESYSNVNAEPETPQDPEALKGSDPALLAKQPIANEKKANSEVGEDEEANSKAVKKEIRKKKVKEALDQFKENSKKAAVNLAKGTARFVFDEINNQINIRARLLEATISKAIMLLGGGGIKNEPKNVYPKPYSPHSFGIFFDVRNELFNFAGNELAGIISGGMNSLLPGTQLNFPFKMPNVGATLDKLTKNFSLYDAEAKLIAQMKSNAPKKPFFDSSKHSKKFSGQTTNKIYNTNTTFKFPATTEKVKFGGGLGVKALHFMKPKGNIYSDGNTKPAKMLEKYSNPLNNKFPIGTKNYNMIGFPSGSQKYPAPLINSAGKLSDLVANSKWKAVGMNNLQFPASGQKDPSPTSKGNDTLKKLFEKSTWNKVGMNNLQFPASAQKQMSPVTSGNSTLKQLVDGGKWKTVGMPNLQFPTSAQRQMPPVTSGNSTLQQLVDGGKWKTVGMTNLQFPTSAQRQMPPVTSGNSTLKQLVDANSKAQTRYGSNSYSNIQFPNSPQKFPNPTSTGNSNLEDIVKSGTKWGYPVNYDKFGK